MSTKRVYTDAGQTAILELQRQGGRLVSLDKLIGTHVQGT